MYLLYSSSSFTWIPALSSLYAKCDGYLSVRLKIVIGCDGWCIRPQASPERTAERIAEPPQPG